MTVGERVRWARTQRGKSLEELAGAAAVHWVTIQAIETGRRTPRRGTLRLLALALQVDEDWLAAGIGTGAPGAGLPVPPGDIKCSL